MKSKLSGIRRVFSIERLDLRRRFAFDEHHDAIIRGLVIVAIFGVLAKLVGAGKEIVVAARYGISPVVDAYLFVFNLLSAPVSIWYGAIFAILVPQFVRMQKENPDAAFAFRREFAGVTLIFGTLVGLLFWGGLYIFLVSGESGLDPSTTILARDALSLMWPIIPLMFVVHYGSTRLIAAKQHVNSFYEGLPALAILIAVLAVPSGSLSILTFGTLIGTIAQLLFTLASLGSIDRIQPPTLRWRSAAWLPILPALCTMLAAQGLQALSAIIDQLIAARLDPGSLATLGYSTRILGLVLTLVALAVPRVMLPVFSELMNDAPERLVSVAIKWASWLFAIGLLGAAGISVLANPIVRVLFERGAFTTLDTERVAGILALLIWQLPFYLASLVLTQLHFSRGTYRNLVVLGAGSVITKLATGLLLSHYFGLAGLAISVCLVFVFQTIYLFLTLFRDHLEENLESPAA